MFYVGKGLHARVNRRGCRSEYWNRVATKYGFNSLILHDNLLEQESLDLEIALIELYRAMGHSLVNITKGGEGTTGHRYVMTEDHKNKIRKALMGNKNGFGQIPSEEKKLRISLAQIGRVKSDTERKNISAGLSGKPSWNAGTHESGMMGKKHSEATKAQMKISAKNRRNKVS